MTKYLPEIIEVYENPLGQFYCLLHKFCVKKFVSVFVCVFKIEICRKTWRKFNVKTSQNSLGIQTRGHIAHVHM